MEEEPLLDGFSLLAASKSNDPEKVKEVTLESMKFSRVIVEDLRLFSNLTFLDLGDNRINLESLSSLSSLKELHLQCNGIQKFGNLEGFRQLLVLDLSYNNILPSEIIKLSKLRKLQHLDLSHNDLDQLPEMEQFTSLEVLNLQQNLLNEECFYKLTRVKELNLANNKIKLIPNICQTFYKIKFINLNQNYIQNISSVPLLFPEGTFIMHEQIELTKPVKKQLIPIQDKEEDDLEANRQNNQDQYSQFFLTEIQLETSPKPNEKDNDSVVGKQNSYSILYQKDDDTDPNPVYKANAQAAVNALRIALKYSSSNCK